MGRFTLFLLVCSALSCGGARGVDSIDIPWERIGVAVECPAETSLWFMDNAEDKQIASKPPAQGRVANCQPGPDGDDTACLPWPQAAWCQRADGTEHGPYVEWHVPTRAVAVRGHFDSGKPHGVWRITARDGRLLRLDQYVSGTLVRSTDKRSLGGVP
jgi:hypothetical protein